MTVDTVLPTPVPPARWRFRSRSKPHRSRELASPGVERSPWNTRGLRAPRRGPGAFGHGLRLLTVEERQPDRELARGAMDQAIGRNQPDSLQGRVVAERPLLADRLATCSMSSSIL